MTPLTERAKILLDLSGGSVTLLAEIAGVKPPSVSDWLNGKTKTLKSSPAARMAKRFNLNISWVAEGVGEMKGIEPKQLVEPGDNRLPIRRALFKLSAGVCGYTIEYENGESDPIFMGKRWFDQHHYKAEKLIAVKVNGRSMEPSLYDGDLVVINTEDVALKDGEVFAANYEGELVIKRLKRDAGNWYLASDNPDKVRFADKLCSDGCGLIGKIVYKQSEHI